jgi:Glycosyltransferase sugar-binding region containing DXD motif
MMSSSVQPAVQSLWIGERLSVMEQLSVCSFLRNGHPFHLYVYNEMEGVPKGTTLKDANEIIRAERIFKYRHHDTYSGFANLFRYRLLFEKGGYWVDTDVVCLRPVQFAMDYLFASVPTGRQLLTLRKRYHIANWFIKAPLASEIMNYCYHEAASRRPDKLAFGETGPKLITAAVGKFGLSKYVAPPGTFCPIYAWQWRQFINGSSITARKWKLTMQSSYALHLYHEMWRRNHVDKGASFPKKSIYEQLKARYLNRD